MPVALEDLCRGRGRFEPEPLAGDALELGIRRRIGSDRAGELSDAHALKRPCHALAVAVELECPARELQPEGRRLRVHAVRAAHLERGAMLLGPYDDRGERPIDLLDDQRPRLPDLEREGRVDDVGRGEAVVEPATLLAELSGDRVDESGGVVVKRRFELGHPLRRWRGRLLQEGARSVRGHNSELGPGGRGGELDLEPDPQLALVRPDPGHGRAGIAGNHCVQSRADPGRQVGTR